MQFVTLIWKLVICSFVKTCDSQLITLYFEICLALLLILWWLKLWDFYGTQHLWCFSDYSSWYFKCLLTGQSMVLIFFTKLTFRLFMIRRFFWLIYFLVVEDYELPEIASHVLTVPLTLECIRILSWSISLFFYFNRLPDDVLCKIAIWADDTVFNSSCHKLSDLLQ